MARDDRFYAFIIARTSRSRSQIRRFCVHKRWLKLFAALALVILCGALYGFYGLAQQARHLRIEHENERLRAENERQRQQLNNLNNRVEAVEDASRRIAETAGVAHEGQAEVRGAGGPALPMDEYAIALIEDKAAHLEEELLTYEAALRERATIPSIWPVEGSLESGFGGRRNPFGGSSYELHTGQDIEAPSGAPVVAAANGTVVIAGWQNGYGQVVYIDHGDGLSTRYGHLSKIEAAVGQIIARGTVLGRVGSTGRSTGPHLHYEVRINDQPVNPRQYLPEQ
ncbi:MAG TPA: peptidoglycan DD-metalloendopeptidase family protein [Pyrinomonadaceae bacterium]|jgi:murein DD-endopeptidase MepM/ murein hydrolase activator NlpD